MNAVSSNRQVALVTGASTGLGFAIAQRFAAAGFDVVIVGRDRERTESAASQIAGDARTVAMVCDVIDRQQVDRLIDDVQQQFGRLDVLVNNVGLSDRGLIQALDADRLNDLFNANVFSALNCSQAALPLLAQSGGQIVNIGSLAAKVAPRYLGGYAAAKHALAAITQQLRLESRVLGVNVILISPGPIRRDDAGYRYKDRVGEDLPESANRPAGGARVKGLDPIYVADRILKACRKRSTDVLLPGYLRPIIAIGHLLPTLGDRILLWFTRSKD
ncbi:putative oxidoreductase [Rosistilla carotiformis]|uniref:Putative oxidoreductase n=1 Tax=Rosistilla carotiformis TaxID=2528017 RepID=A0A518JNM1_9BACT|nr:SDR family oxidoreductase [Rosistilla carotiformis]QDV67146.1 putative oxidoreductase [Rosistilla carotiformis]